MTLEGAAIQAGGWLLGLDAGTNSLGWAAIRLDENDKPMTLLDGGVRLFEWGRNDKLKTSLEAERGKERRGRRRLRARKWRVQELRRMLAAYGMDPPQCSPSNAWNLRAEAATRRVAPHELAAALMHMARHRGFKSVRLGREASEQERKESNKELSRWEEQDRTLRQEIAAKHCWTVGQLFAGRLASPVASRTQSYVRARRGVGDVPNRVMIREEFDCIREEQSRNEDVTQRRPEDQAAEVTLTDAQWNTIADIIFEQRPLGEPRRGPCSAYPNDIRLPKAMPSAQRFLVRQALANLRIDDGSLEPPKPLEPEQFNAMADILDGGGTHPWARLRKALNLGKQVKFTIERERAPGENKSASKEVAGDATTAVLGELVPDWSAMLLSDRDAVVNRLLKHENRHDRRRLKTIAGELNVPETDRDNFADAVQFRLPRGTIAYGARAVANLLQELAPSVPLHVACERAFGDARDGKPSERLRELPDYETVVPGGRIGNVTVHIALGEIRKVVNALIRRYGSPRRIVVETVRELKASAERLRAIEKEQAKREQQNRDDDADIARSMGGTAERARLGRTERLRRWRLLGRQSEFCPYCGVRIGRSDLFEASIEIDHVVPRALGGPDDWSNWVVSHRECNQEKARRTPWRAFQHTQRWAKIQEFLEHLSERDEALRRRFGPDAEVEDDDEWLPRQDRDASYVARVALQYLKLVAEDVVATRGRQTSYLRAAWDLPKWREDQRNHFIDAAVIACTDRAIIQWLNTLHGRHGRLPLAEETDVAEPYPGFHAEIMRRWERMWPSVRPDHSLGAQTIGKLHDALPFGVVDEHGKRVRQDAGISGEAPVRRFRRRGIEELFLINPNSKSQTDGADSDEGDEALEAIHEKRHAKKGKSNFVTDEAAQAVLASFMSEPFRKRFERAIERERAARSRTGAAVPCLAELALAAARQPQFGPRGIGKIACMEDKHARPYQDFCRVPRGNHRAVVQTDGNAWLEIKSNAKTKWEACVITRMEAAAAKGDPPSDAIYILRRRDTVSWEQDGHTEYGWVKVIKSAGDFFVWPLRVAETVDPKKRDVGLGSDGRALPGRHWALAELQRLGVPNRNGKSFTAESFRKAKGRRVTVNILGRVRHPGRGQG